MDQQSHLFYMFLFWVFEKGAKYEMGKKKKKP